ncbi:MULTISPECIES: hypothetical protein [unclassified Aureimonas]|uniref:hypothetical protein n=1 Tax=unclassified Aureimonas TaxID=2615206 RepID=UPI0006FDE1F3|nr:MULTISPECIES: hypothetical protein [unclassified Aureimonas]KQT66081.1 hypothetical protein ASG62_19920 [Aureimonas sp. Leaf427]KQT81055.1 hypothetical protein ASG54_06330 [Aureimonas sp. Leaf460]
MKTSWLGVSVSALALACAAPSARAGEVSRPAIDRFSTESLLAPSFSMRAPISAAFLLGVDSIKDTSLPGVDRMRTGQISKPGDMDGMTSAILPTTSAAAVEPASAEVVPVSAPAPSEPAAAAPSVGTVEPEVAAQPGEAAPEAKAHDEAAPAEAEAHPDEHKAAPTFAEVRGPAPFDIIRTIQFLQDQISRGNGRAIRVQAALLRRFGPVFLASDPEVWKDGRNRRAAVLFVLSGGPPEVLRRLLQSGHLENDPEALFQGALSYVQNDLDKAQRLLSEVDLKGMEPGLAAHIHLVLGQMQQKKDPEASLRNLDQARLLAPGGLIEEAALRMEVLIAEDKGLHEAADRLARQYFDRYARSSYSANFEARFAAVYASRQVEDPKTSVDTVLDVTARLTPDSRRSLLLAVARRALVDGKLSLAELASDAAGSIEGIAPAEKQRAELYATAARLGKAPTSDAAALLDAIRRDELHPDDVKLLDAAHSVIAGIERPLDAPGEAEDGDAAEASPVYARAERLLSEVSDDLGKVQK